jgi:phage tail tape-measure protein
MGGPVPVVVLNWPGGAASAWAPGMGSGGKAAPTRASGRVAGLARRAGGFLGRLGGRALLPLALLDGGIDMVGSLMAGDRAGAAGAGGRMAGGVAGAATGAALGSVIPGFGTAIGGIAGGLVGALGGEQLFRAGSRWFGSGDDTAAEKRGAPTKNHDTRFRGEVTVTFENAPAGMKVSRLRSSSRDFDLNVDVGPMMVSP